MPGVAIVAHSPLVRAGLEAALRLAPGFTLTESVGILSELTERSAQSRILLVELPDGDEMQAWQRLQSSGMPLVLLSDVAPQEWLDSLRLGGIALLSRQAEPRAIHAALGAVENGLTVLSPELIAALLEDVPPTSVDSAEAGALERLTTRELEVVKLLAAGLSNKGIARRLEVSEHTAKFHVGQILAKLNAKSRTEAVAVALRRGLVGM